MMYLAINVMEVQKDLMLKDINQSLKFSRKELNLYWHVGLLKVKVRRGPRRLLLPARRIISHFQIKMEESLFLTLK